MENTSDEDNSEFDSEAEQLPSMPLELNETVRWVQSSYRHSSKSNDSMNVVTLQQLR